MRVDWFKADKKLPRRAKIARIMELTGLDREQVLGRLWIFWAWVHDNVKSDGLLRVTRVTTLVEIFGYEEAFWNALQDKNVTWLGNGPDGFFVPSWGKWFARKDNQYLTSAEKQKAYRERKKLDPESAASQSALRNGELVRRNARYQTLPPHSQDKTRPDKTRSTKTGLPATGGRRAGVFKSMTSDTLRDDRALLAWFRDAAGRRKPVVSDSEANRLRVFGAAERALSESDNPPRLFAWIVAGQHWEFITQEHEDRARKRLARTNGPRSGKRAPAPDAAAEFENHRKSELAKLDAIDGPQPRAAGSH